MSTPATVHIIPVDPYDKVTGLLFPLVIQRIRDYGRTLKLEVNCDVLAKATAIRLCQQDPAVLAVAYVQSGKIVGHGMATLEMLGPERWVFVEQSHLDPKVNGGDVIKRAIEQVTEWGRSMGATRLMFGTHRKDEGWVKKHGFTTVRHLMAKAITEESDPE